MTHMPAATRLLWADRPTSLLHRLLCTSQLSEQAPVVAGLALSRPAYTWQVWQSPVHLTFIVSGLPLGSQRGQPCGSLILSHSTCTSGSPTLSSHSTDALSGASLSLSTADTSCLQRPFAQGGQQEGGLA